MVQRRVGREEWARRVRELEESGESVAAYARRKRLNARSLTWWRWKLGQVPEGFVELASSGPTSSDRVEVVLTNGRVVRVPASFDAMVLAELLTVVEGT